MSEPQAGEPSAAPETGRALVAAYLEETRSAGPYWAVVRPRDYPSGRALLGADPAVQLAAVRVALATLAATRAAADGLLPSGAGAQDGLVRLASVQAAAAHAAAETAAAVTADDGEKALSLPANTLDSYAVRRRLVALLGGLVRRRLPYDTADLRRMLASLGGLQPGRDLPVQSLLRAVQRHVAEHGLEPEVAQALAGLRAAGARHASHADGRKALALIDEILADSPTDAPLVEPDDWGAAARGALAALAPAERRAWQRLLAHAQTATASKPSGAWQAAARERIAALGEDRFKAQAMAWLALLQAPLSTEYRRGAGIGALAGLNRIPRAVPTERNATLLRGLVWCCGLLDDAALAAAVADAGAACFKKIPETGARSTKVGNACLYALSAMPGSHGASELVRLERQLKQPSARERLDASLERSAERAGLTREDLEDRAVPTHDLVDGRRRLPVGPYTVEIVVRGPRAVDLVWFDAAGAPLAEEPPEARRVHAAAHRRARGLADEVRKSLLAQRDRLERLLAAERTWPLAAWRERYLDHPLLAVLARRLIWAFGDGEQRALGAWLDGRLVGADDALLDALADDTPVRLWHPIASPPAAVLAWRQWLARHAVTQPFKQAHREVYLLTDAERATETHSQRFAGHVLRQHQLQALCRERGWRYALQGSFDTANSPTLPLPRWGLRAEFDVEPIEDDDMVSANAIFLYVSTEEVRFVREAPPRGGQSPRQALLARQRRLLAALAEGGLPAFRAAAAEYRGGVGQPVALSEVPPVVFSEVMRDVDLFVGVSSVGADPTWLEAAPDRYADYWSSFSFGELSPSAETRRAVLEQVLPRLVIGPRCHLDGRFLVVRGALRTYRIHLGSGNVLMEPNDQYLCIVPRGLGLPGESGHLYLPFEGDTLLAVILSKAFLLADDRAIKDPTILSQIKCGL